jgi:hypothetical protein
MVYVSRLWGFRLWGLRCEGGAPWQEWVTSR